MDPTHHGIQSRLVDVTKYTLYKSYRHVFLNPIQSAVIIMAMDHVVSLLTTSTSSVVSG